MANKPYPLRAAAILLALLAWQGSVAQVPLNQGTNLAVDVSPTDGRIAMDLLGSIWITPRNGGAAVKVSNGLQPAARPRWSPGGDRILFQTVSASGSRLWVFDPDTATARNLSDGMDFDQHPEWHPSGERIAFSSARGDSGFDLWEMHLETGLSWRLTHSDGDETEPAWSADGRDLAFIRRRDDQWRLVLRRHGQQEQDLLVSDKPLAAPSWRPDGSLITYLRSAENGYSLEMVILSDPPLVRALARNEDFFLSPVSWRDRLHFIYTADGVIKSRGLNEWKAKKIPFTAEVQLGTPRPSASLDVAPLPVVSPPADRLVIRAARLFDGEGADYRSDVDVLIENGTIIAVERRREWTDATVLDLGEATVLPGFIDSYATLPKRDPGELGAALLSYGITTIVADGTVGFDPATWEREETPGPRLLRAAPLYATVDDQAPLALLTLPASGIPDGGSRGLQDPLERSLPLLAESWRTGIAAGAELLLGADTMPASPLGRRYRDIRAAAGAAGPVALVSGLADAGTPGIAKLLQSRQAQALEHWTAGKTAAPRRFSEIKDLAGATRVVAGSKPNRLPPGLGLHAELLALQSVGLSADQVLKAAGANAADALGHPSQLGRAVPGALADLVLVAGDPLARPADALNIIAVVRNGRFYSLVRLLEAAAGSGVE